MSEKSSLSCSTFYDVGIRVFVLRWRCWETFTGCISPAERGQLELSLALFTLAHHVFDCFYGRFGLSVSLLMMWRGCFVDKIPFCGEGHELCSAKLCSLIRNYFLWNSVNREEFLQMGYYGSWWGMRQVKYKWKVWEIINHHEEVFVIKLKYIQPDSLPWSRCRRQRNKRFMRLGTVENLTWFAFFNFLPDIVADAWPKYAVSCPAKCSLDSDVSHMQIFEHLISHDLWYEDSVTLE